MDGIITLSIIMAQVHSLFDEVSLQILIIGIYGISHQRGSILSIAGDGCTMTNHNLQHFVGDKVCIELSVKEIIVTPHQIIQWRQFGTITLVGIEILTGIKNLHHLDSIRTLALRVSGNIVHHDIDGGISIIDHIQITPCICNNLTHLRRSFSIKSTQDRFVEQGNGTFDATGRLKLETVGMDKIRFLLQ